MKVASVDFKVCSGADCTKCPAIKACERRIIIKLDEDEPAVVDKALCSGCGDCLPACRYAAIRIIEA